MAHTPVTTYGKTKNIKPPPKGPPKGTPTPIWPQGVTPPVAGTPAAAATGAAGTPAKPLDPGIEAVKSSAGARKATTIADVEADKVTTAADYGYTPTYDTAGNLTGATFDPNNPFSKAALALRNYGQQQAGAQTSFAARGALSSGAFGRTKAFNEFNYQATDDALKKAFAEAMKRLARTSRDATLTEGETVANAILGGAPTQ